ncbi:NAD(P)-dependent alcohol dehydrogenase [Nocardioides sp. zg-1308]|uniref:alcohol dehydrogenase (NADP(+)) n=1 Tax=Nocardioides renjunii TaxID=3095075 RepID=A0ABU5KD29_9ACTN|nr:MULTISPECIES: NAD(P)-dependent alcohol dehydrogenase [unclassified Nocardioides]MDZ5662880.1 NAD(P)-dependent alcohol dehydrogenase [Nocardioides sp. S-58]NPD05452.1 NAD(P)-dependent alcohol dehydrogenase [Nocardioides sp. zg-1308]
MSKVTGYRATDRPGEVELVGLTRRDLRPDDVEVRISHCGVCHTDLHALSGSAAGRGGTPLVPGHEFVGEVVATGPAVTSFAVGDPVAVGNIVDSCGTCAMCVAGQENMCVEFPTLTYGGTDRVDGSTTLGGWSSSYVVREDFVYHRPPALDPAAVAPLMCAGVTVWEPLRVWGAGPGTRVGVVGLGGLGHLAVKLAVALGAEVTVFTRTADKAADARALGAHRVVLSTDEQDMAAAGESLDLVIDCVPGAHEVGPYLRTLALDGTLVVVGHLGEVRVDAMDLLRARRRLASSGSAGRARTQELLDFCGEHGVTADVETVPSAQVATALERLGRNDVRYRFTLDLRDLG